jgi:hypothetical protein
LGDLEAPKIHVSALFHPLKYSEIMQSVFALWCQNKTATTSVLQEDDVLEPLTWEDGFPVFYVGMFIVTSGEQNWYLWMPLMESRFYVLYFVYDD